MIKKSVPHSRSESGQAIVLIAFAMLGIFALAGLALDGGHAFADRRQAQSAADSAAMAAALARVSNQDAMTVAFARASSNGYPNDGERSAVIVEQPPRSGDYSCVIKPDCQNYIKVTITSHVQTWFAGIVGVSTLTNQVSAVAVARRKVSLPFYDGSAVVALNETQCRSLYFTGSSTTTISGSGIFVNSNCATNDPNSPQQAFYSSGNGYLKAPWVSVVGGAYYDQTKVILDNPLTSGVMPYKGVTDIREAYDLPAPTCGAGGMVDPNDAATALPGTYTGGFPPQGVAHLMPGVYCVDELKINSDLSGSEVVFVVTGGVRMNGNAAISLKAKTQGDFAGLLIYMPPSHMQPIFIDGNSSLELTGLILAPASDITINGTGSSDRFHSQIIGNTVSFSGNSAMRITYLDEDNYNPVTPPMVGLVR